MTQRTNMLIVALVFSLLWVGVAWAGEPQPPEPPQNDPKPPETTPVLPKEPVPDLGGVNDEQIAKLINELGSDDFDEREKAEASLRQAGSRAKAALDQAAGQTNDPEIKLRAVRLLQELQFRNDNPYTKAKVGDWAEYTMTTELNSVNIKGSQRKEVLKKTDTEVTLELTIQMNMAGLNGNAAKIMQPMKNTIVIPLDKKFTPGKPETQDMEVKELGTGNETVTVTGKSLECKWVETEWSSTKQQAMKGKTKVWMSKDIPLDGIVKITSELSQGTSTMELKDFSFGK